MQPIEVPTKVQNRACFLQWIGALSIEPMRFEQAASTLQGIDLLAVIEANEKQGPPSIFSDSVYSIAAALKLAGMDVTLAKPEAVSDESNAKDEAGIPPYAIVGGTAIIPVNGPLSKQPGSLSSLFGGSSTIGMRKALSLAMADARVQRIMFHVDSPGGTVAGTGDLGDDIYIASSKKPIAAYIEDMGTSAAYWVASQANLIYASPYANVGSIGVIWTVYDRSEMANKMGIKVHAIMSNPGKAFAVDGMPITAKQLAKMQKHVDETYAQFVGAVARGRDVGIEEARAMSGDADIYNATDAFNKGLVDMVMTLKDAVQDFAKVQPSILRSATYVPALMRGKKLTADNRTIASIAEMTFGASGNLLESVSIETASIAPGQLVESTVREVDSTSNRAAGIVASQGVTSVNPDSKNPAAESAAAPVQLSAAEVAELRRNANLGVEALNKVNAIEAASKEKAAKALSDKRDALMADYGATKEEVLACSDMESLGALESTYKRLKVKRTGADPAGASTLDAEAVAHLQQVDEGRAAWIESIRLTKED